MKKLYIVIVAVVLNMSYSSCTPQQLSDESVQACCGDDIPILPPPPPPPKVGG